MRYRNGRNTAMRKHLIGVVLLCGVGFNQASAFAQEGQVARDGFNLHWRTEGSGKPVILLSGGPCFAADLMKPVVQKLTNEDLVNIAAYTASRPVNGAAAN